MLGETFTMDYQRSLKFQIIPEETDVQPAQPTKSAKITIPEGDETSKVVVFTYCSSYSYIVDS